MPVTIGKPVRVPSEAREYSSSYVMDGSELRHAASAHVSCRFSWVSWLVMKCLGVPLSLVCLLGLVILVRGPENEFRVMFMAMYGLFLLIGLGLVFHGVLFVWVNTRRRELRSLIGQEIISVVSCEGVSSSLLGTSQVVSWRGFRRGKVTRHGLLLDLDGGSFHWLPASSFGDASCWERVKALAEGHLRKV